MGKGDTLRAIIACRVSLRIVACLPRCRFGREMPQHALPPRCRLLQGLSLERPQQHPLVPPVVAECHLWMMQVRESCRLILRPSLIRQC